MADEEVVLDALTYTYVVLGMVGLLSTYVYVSTWLSLEPGADTVSVLGMILPANLVFVLIPCHLILTPWTFAQAYGASRREEWFLVNEVWFTLIAFGMSFVENMYRGPYTPLVLCICLFDWLVDVFAALSYRLGMYTRTGASVLAHAPMAVVWASYGFASSPTDPFLVGLSMLFGLSNGFMIYRGFRGDEGASYALYLLRCIDAAIFLWCYMATGLMNYLVFVLLSAAAIMANAKIE